MRSTLVTEESSSLFNQEALAGKVVQIPRGKLSLVEIAIAAEGAGAVGLVVVSDEDDPDAVSCVDDDSSLSDPSARVVKLVWADLHHASTSIDDETGRVAETLPDAARGAGIRAGAVLVGAACSRLGTPVQRGHHLREMCQGCLGLGDGDEGFKRVLVSSGLLQSEEDFEENIEEIMDTLEFELHFRPAIGIPVVMVSRSVGVRTVELDPGTAVVLGGRRASRVRRSCPRGESCPRSGMDGSLVPEGSAAPRVKIEQVKEEEGDYHHLFFEAAPKGGCLRWSVELGEAGSSRSWRNSRIGIATRTDEIDRSPNQRAGLNLGIATGGAFVERRGGLDKTTRSSGRTRPGQALVFELDLSGDGFFAIYHGVKAAGSSWVPGELVHKCASCVDASLNDYEWHPCVARVRLSLSLAFTHALGR